MLYEHTILLIDDEVNILKSLKRLFEGEDYLVLTAQNAAEGLNVLKQSGVDLIICDQKMPGLSGLDFLQKTLPQYPDIIRIILTGHAELDMAIEAINNGCIYKFILKPWNNDDLLITVKRALEQLDLLRENKNLTQELKKQEVILNELEKRHPGITKMPKDGIYRIS